VTDPRLLRSNGRAAHVSLKGQVAADRFVEGELKRVGWVHRAVPLSRSPRGGRAKEILAGQAFCVLDNEGDHAFGFDPMDGYVGYVHSITLEPGSPSTHRIVAAGSHAYSDADMKSFCLGRISMGAEIAVQEERDGFLRIDDMGLWVPVQHARALDVNEDDPAAVATRLLGTPYLWGGNSSTGIDCSGLTQMALRLCGIGCPRDSDQQEAAFAEVTGPTQRGDLVFWKGHVGMLLDPDTLIHANAHHMAVAIEPLAAAVARIGRREFGAVTKIARPS